MDAVIKMIFEGIIDGNASQVVDNMETALSNGLLPADILNQGMIAAMGEVGRLFEEGEYFVPEMLIAARAMQKGLELLKPHLADLELQSSGRIVIGTVKGDLHDIGKNLVIMMLEGAAFEVIDLGVDVGPEQFAEAIVEKKPQVVAMSALLTTTMPNMKKVIDYLVERDLRDTVKIMVGGAPVTPGFAEKIGADGYAEDASRTVTKVKQLLNV